MAKSWAKKAELQLGDKVADISQGRDESAGMIGKE